MTLLFTTLETCGLRRKQSLVILFRAWRVLIEHKQIFVLSQSCSFCCNIFDMIRHVLRGRGCSCLASACRRVTCAQRRSNVSDRKYACFMMVVSFFQSRSSRDVGKNSSSSKASLEKTAGKAVLFYVCVLPILHPSFGSLVT